MLIDTAGRYTTQDSDAKADQQELARLPRPAQEEPPEAADQRRPRRISLEDLLTLTPEEIAAHADAIRTRLLELHEQLKVDFPVYALFTKADLVAGFMRVFGGLTESERAHGLGRTRSRPTTRRAT